MEGVRGGNDTLPDDARRQAVHQSGFAEKWTPLVARQLAGESTGGPLAQQFVFDPRENDVVAGFGPDPVGDQAAEVVPGLLHKYEGRVLVVATGACAVHCRYCFRRHFPYEAHRLDAAAIGQVIDYIRADDSIREVILSGGDPLVLSPRRLRELIGLLADIPHLARLRIHSRVPSVAPTRMTDDMIDALSAHRLATVLVTHINHPAELGDEFRAVTGSLRERGVWLLNQSVLLAEVNDDEQVLADLSERLFAFGILPYYLHALDPVAGAAHFAVSRAEGVRLIERLRSRLPGFLVPRFVVEEAGEGSKTPLG